MHLQRFLPYRKKCASLSSSLVVMILMIDMAFFKVSGQSNLTSLTVMDQKSSNKSTTSKESKIKKPKESAPYYSFAAWDNWGKICLLLKLDAMFTISYETGYGKQQLINILPLDSEMRGRCANVLDPNSVMDITWKGGFMFRFVFEKV